MKKFLISTVEKIHLRIFGHKMSSQMRAFLGNLSWSFYSGIIAMPVTMVVVTLAGRFMGPQQFGKYSLILLICTYINAFSFFGLDISTIKNVAKAKSLEKKQQSFFSSFVFVALVTILVLATMLFFRQKIASAFSLDKALILFVIVYAFVATLKMIQDILARALEKFKLQATSKMAEIFILVSGFIFATAIYKKLNYGLFVGIVSLGALLAAVIYFIYLKGYFKNFSLSTLRMQLSEGKFFMLSAVFGIIFLSSDRLLIAKYIGVGALGIYSAYYAASISLITGLSLILTNVLFSASAKTEDKGFILKIDKLCLKSFVPIYLFICATIFVFLTLFGRAYPLKLEYVLLFAVIATLYFFQTIYNVVILDAPRKKYIRYFVISNIINLVSIAYYFVVLRYVRESINLVLIGFSLNCIVTLIVQVIVTRQMIKCPARLSPERLYGKN